MLLRRHALDPEHRLGGPTGVLAAVELLQGEDFPARVWEQDLLVPRVEDYQREWLDRLGLAGEIVWTVFEPRQTTAARPGRVGLALRENAGWLRPAPTPRADLDPKVKNVLLHLQLRGASFAQDLARGAGLDTAGTLAALWGLFWAGLVTPVTFSAIVAGSAPSRPEAPRPAPRGRPARAGAHARRPRDLRGAGGPARPPRARGPRQSLGSRVHAPPSRRPARRRRSHPDDMADHAPRPSRVARRRAGPRAHDTGR